METQPSPEEWGILDAFLRYEIDAEEMVRRLVAARPPAEGNPGGTARALQAIRRINGWR